MVRYAVPVLVMEFCRVRLLCDDVLHTTRQPKFRGAGRELFWESLLCDALAIVIRVG